MGAHGDDVGEQDEGFTGADFGESVEAVADHLAGHLEAYAGAEQQNALVENTAAEQKCPPVQIDENHPEAEDLADLDEAVPLFEVEGQEVGTDEEGSGKDSKAPNPVDGEMKTDQSAVSELQHEAEQDEVHGDLGQSEVLEVAEVVPIDLYDDGSSSEENQQDGVEDGKGVVSVGGAKESRQQKQLECDGRKCTPLHYEIKN